jgi:hypothetical protein
MDIAAVNLAIATSADAIEFLNCYGVKPDGMVEPAFYPTDADIEFDQTMGRGQDKITSTWHLAISKADDEAGQAVLNSLLKGSGATSLKAAIQADRTLGGACATLRVTRLRTSRMILVGVVEYYGAELTIDVYGRGD